MTRGIKVRLLAFLMLGVVGIVYVGSAYLGVVDRVLGRGIHVSAALPSSGGLYEGSQVAYRGVKIGKVSKMTLSPTGVIVDLALNDDARVPAAAEFEVSSLSAVGEQYLNFIPANDSGPYLKDGDSITGTSKVLPPSVDDLLTSLDGFVDSIDPQDLKTVVSELGQMFAGNARNVQILMESAAELVDQATAHTDETIALLQSGRTVLRTQHEHRADIRAFASGLAQVSESLRKANPDLRTILDSGEGAIDEVRSLVEGLQPVLRPFMKNLVAINQVLTARLPALEQLLVTLPIAVKNNFFGTPGDGYGHIQMQYTYTAEPCQQGFMPSDQWPSPHDLTDAPTYPAGCKDPRSYPDYTGNDPIVQRGVNMVPEVDDADPIYHAEPYGPVKSEPSFFAEKEADDSLQTLIATRGWEEMFSGPGISR